MMKSLGVQTRPPLTGFHRSSLRRRFASGALWSVGGAILSRGLTLLAAIMAGRLLGTVGFGELGMVQSTLGVCGVFAGAGLGLTATKYVAEYRSSDAPLAGNYLAMAMAITVISGAAVSLLLFLLAPWIAADVLAQPGLVGELRIATGLVLFGAINGVQGGAIIGLEEFGVMALMSTIRGALLLVLLVAGTYFFGLWGAVVGMTISEGAAAVASQMALRHVCRKAKLPVQYTQIDWHQVGPVARFALPALLSSLVTQPALWLCNILLIQQPGGYAALGVFSAADKWRQLLLFLPSSLSAMVLPLLSNLHGTRNRGGFRKVFQVNLLVNLGSVLVPAAGLALLALPAMGVYGAAYRDGGQVLVILAGASVAMVLNNVLGQVLVSVGRIWWRCLLDVILAVGLVGWALWLIPLYGANGMALASLLAFTITAGLLFVPVWHTLRRARDVEA